MFTSILFVLFVFAIGIALSEWLDPPQYKDRSDEIALRQLKEIQADMIWKLSLNDLVNLDHTKIYPENSDVVTDRIYDHMEEMSPGRLRNFIPKLKRFNEDMIQDAMDLALG